MSLYQFLFLSLLYKNATLYSTLLTYDDLKNIREIVKEEVNKRDKQMEQDRKDWSEFFNHAGIFFDEMRNQLSKRIKKLEDKQGFSKN